MRRLHPDYVRSLVFGSEDSLVSTTGVIAGLSAGSQDVKIVLLGGAVAIVVEALSMAAGQYTSERAVHQLEPSHTDSLAMGASLMFISYLTAGLVPLAPIVLLPYPASITVSILAALLALFCLGWVKGRVVKVPALRSGVEVLVIGGLATLLGVAVGIIFKL